MSGSTSAQRVTGILSRQRVSSQPSKHAPNAAPVLVLYRSLLRELSYLPPAIRLNIQKPLVERFRKDSRKPLKEGQLHRGGNVLRRVRSANAGDAKSMDDLIQRAFGRKGSQRHDLMHNLLSDNAIERKRSSEAGEETAVRGAISATNQARQFAHERFDKDKVMALMKSQKAIQNQHKGSISWGSQSINPKRYYPTDGLNIWGKPMHEKPLQRKEQRFWNEALDKIYAPVDKATWDHMAKLAKEKSPVGEAWTPARRTPARPLRPRQQESMMDDWDWEKFAKQSTSKVESSKRHDQQRRSGKTPLGPYGMAKVMRPVNERTFRRSLERAWLSTPYMEEKNGKTDFKFAKKETIPARPTALQAAMLKAMKDSGGQKRGRTSKD